MVIAMLGTISTLLAVFGALFAYYKFFREGPHQQRIECDIDFRDLGVFDRHRVIEVSIVASNRGHVEQKFDDIRLTLRGIEEGARLGELAGHLPRLCFPEKIGPIAVIPKKFGYFFVRPGVCQRFPVVVRIPEAWTYVQARSSFKYLGLEDVHIAERSFRVDAD